mmetsp:Transcript_77880/g.208102  ORF Transcript_77880/g.208102 Transcript_77880/m.208102 type:complete len:319 (-) Transcript_77880:61-1017(-)
MLSAVRAAHCANADLAHSRYLRAFLALLPFRLGMGRAKSRAYAEHSADKKLCTCNSRQSSVVALRSPTIACATAFPTCTEVLVTKIAKSLSSTVASSILSESWIGIRWLWSRTGMPASRSSAASFHAASTASTSPALWGRDAQTSNPAPVSLIRRLPELSTVIFSSSGTRASNGAPSRPETRTRRARIAATATRKISGDKPEDRDNEAIRRRSRAVLRAAGVPANCPSCTGVQKIVDSARTDCRRREKYCAILPRPLRWLIKVATASTILSSLLNGAQLVLVTDAWYRYAPRLTRMTTSPSWMDVVATPSEDTLWAVA